MRAVRRNAYYQNVSAMEGRNAFPAKPEHNDERIKRTTIFKSTTPQSLDSETLSFCQSISRHDPLYLRYTHANYQAGDCHLNVREHVRRNGGRSISGWIIWRSGADWFEAEHHSVREDQQGNLHDLTPRYDGEELILSLPDPLRTFDFKHMKGWCNRLNWRGYSSFAFASIPTNQERFRFKGGAVVFRSC